MLSIKVNVEGKEETILAPKLTMRETRVVAEYLKQIEEQDLTWLEQFDRGVELTVEIFKNDKVSYDSIMDSLEPDDFREVIMSNFYKIVDMETKKKGLATRILTEDFQKMKYLMVMEEETKNPSPIENSTK